MSRPSWRRIPPHGHLDVWDLDRKCAYLCRNPGVECLNQSMGFVDHVARYQRLKSNDLTAPLAWLRCNTDCVTHWGVGRLTLDIQADRASTTEDASGLPHMFDVVIRQRNGMFTAIRQAMKGFAWRRGNAKRRVWLQLDLGVLE